MRVIAIIAVRNEAAYIGRCLQHLTTQGVEFLIIDNGSTDETLRIVETCGGNGLIDIIQFPYCGTYDWTGLLSLKEEIAGRLDADWIIHQDADEILESPIEGHTLNEALVHVARSGYNAVNFDEFCFIPVDENENYEGSDYVALMRNYFFFEPAPLRLVRAWYGNKEVSLSASGGHLAEFDGRKIWPANFILRHYIGLSLRFLREKYTRNRTYSQVETEEKGWHGWRATIQPDQIRCVPKELVTSLDVEPRWDRSRPYRKHLFVAD